MKEIEGKIISTALKGQVRKNAASSIAKYIQAMPLCLIMISFVLAKETWFQLHYMANGEWRWS